MTLRPEPICEPIRTLVTATDLSPSALPGLAWARALAAEHGAALHVVHVLPPLLASGEGPWLADLSSTLEEAARASLEEIAEASRREGLDVICHVETGVPYHRLVDALETLGADAAVLSTRGQSGLRDLLSGSTARRTVRHAPCPVLTVHPEVSEPVARPERIVVGVDFSGHSTAAIDAALTLLPPGPDARLRLLHAWSPPVGLAAYGYSSTAELSRRLAAGREGTRERLEELAARLRRPGLEVEARLVEGYPDAVLLAEARALAAQLLVTGTQGLSGLPRRVLGSVAERVVQQAPCAVLTARAVV